jgi:signal recognition particle subunit SRP54
MTGQMEQELKKTEAIINSMTPTERENHTLINASRQMRIAKGSGTHVNDVKKLIKQYVEMKMMMQDMMGGGDGMLGGLRGKAVRKLAGVGGRKKHNKKKKKGRR